MTRIAMLACLMLAACSTAPGVDTDVAPDAPIPVDAVDARAPADTGAYTYDADDSASAQDSAVDASDSSDAGVDTYDASADAEAPVDASTGPLDTPYAAAVVEVAFRSTSSASTTRVTDVTRTVAPTRCFYAASSGEVRANVYTCAGCPMAMLARLARPADADAGMFDFLSWEITGTPQPITDIRVTRGAPYRAGGVARQSFHVQFRAREVPTRPGLSGIPDTSPDPAYGDLWLLGCPLE